MESTESISVSNYPFLRYDRQHFSKKRQPNFRNRPFYPLIGRLVLFTCPEMTLFSNDTAADIRKDGLGHRVRKEPLFSGSGFTSVMGGGREGLETWCRRNFVRGPAVRIEDIPARASWARDIFRPPGINPLNCPGRIFVEVGALPPGGVRRGGARAGGGWADPGPGWRDRRQLLIRRALKSGGY